MIYSSNHSPAFHLHLISSFPHFLPFHPIIPINPINLSLQMSDGSALEHAFDGVRPHGERAMHGHRRSVRDGRRRVHRRHGRQQRRRQTWRLERQIVLRRRFGETKKKMNNVDSVWRQFTCLGKMGCRKRRQNRVKES